MTTSLHTDLHRLRKLYRDAHHCDPATDQHAIKWASSPELWATHQIRYRNWSYEATEATVREARRLFNRIAAAGHPHQQACDPFDSLIPTADSQTAGSDEA